MPDPRDEMKSEIVHALTGIMSHHLDQYKADHRSTFGADVSAGKHDEWLSGIIKNLPMVKELTDSRDEARVAASVLATLMTEAEPDMVAIEGVLEIVNGWTT